MSRLGDILARARGDDSVAAFARRLGYSYTFVRAVQKGSRLPSDRVLEDIAGTLGLDSETLAIATYADRSRLLADALRRRGIDADDLRRTAKPAAPALDREEDEPDLRPDASFGMLAEAERNASA